MKGNSSPRRTKRSLIYTALYLSIGTIFFLSLRVDPTLTGVLLALIAWGLGVTTLVRWAWGLSRKRPAQHAATSTHSNAGVARGAMASALLTRDLNTHTSLRKDVVAMRAIPALHIPLKDMNLDELRDELNHCNRRLFNDSEKIYSAMELACWAHKGQTRKWRKGHARTPYAEHPLRCALRLIRKGCLDTDLIVAALLHDVVEDCALRVANELGDDTDTLSATGVITDEATGRTIALELIEANFGHRSASIVLAVTNPLAEETAPGIVPSALVKQDLYEGHIEDMLATGDMDAVLVKVSDMLDNAGSLQHQYGHVSDEMIIKLIRKYSFPLHMFIDHLNQLNKEDFEDHRNGMLIANLGHSLLKTSSSLEEIELDMRRLAILD